MCFYVITSYFTSITSMPQTSALFVSLAPLMAAAKEAENALEDVALVAGTQQNLSNLLSIILIYLCSVEASKGVS
jgi:hypothetical protein